MFEVRLVWLHSTQAKSSYQNEGSEKKLPKESVAEIVVHFWCVRLSWAKMSCGLWSRAMRPVPPDIWEWTNKMNFVLPLVKE